MEPIQIVVAFNPQTGEVSLSAPNDKIVAYGLLEIARDLIAARKEEPAPKILRPTVVPNIGGRG